MGRWPDGLQSFVVCSGCICRRSPKYFLFLLVKSLILFSTMVLIIFSEIPSSEEPWIQITILLTKVLTLGMCLFNNVQCLYFQEDYMILFPVLRSYYDGVRATLLKSPYLPTCHNHRYYVNFSLKKHSNRVAILSRNALHMTVTSSSVWLERNFRCPPTSLRMTGRLGKTECPIIEWVP